MPGAVICRHKMIELNSLKKNPKKSLSKGAPRCSSTFSHCGKSKRIETKDERSLYSPDNNNDSTSINQSVNYLASNRCH